MDNDVYVNVNHSELQPKTEAAPRTQAAAQADHCLSSITVFFHANIFQYPKSYSFATWMTASRKSCISSEPLPRLG